MRKSTARSSYKKKLATEAPTKLQVPRKEDIFEIELNGKPALVAHMWVPVNKLIVDNRYQHGLSESRAGRYAANWDESLLGLITVSERKSEDGYAIIDGQHRSRAAQIRGEAKMWAEVFFDLTLQDEAYLFWQRNKERTPINSLDQYRAALTAGDDETVEIQQVLDEVGVFVGDQASNPDAYRATAALGTLRRWGGSAMLKEVLKLSRAAWPAEPRTKEKILMLGLGMFLWNYGSQIDRKRLIDALGKRQRPSKLIQDAMTLKATLGQRDWEHMARLLCKAYNSEDRSGKLDETKLRPPSKHSPA